MFDTASPGGLTGGPAKWVVGGPLHTKCAKAGGRGALQSRIEKSTINHHENILIIYTYFPYPNKNKEVQVNTNHKNTVLVLSSGE